MHKFHDDDFDHIEYALQNYSIDILQENYSQSSILTKLW